MNAEHYKLWNTCRSFVKVACEGRDASHGLAHMETVTRQAVLIFLMNHTGETAEYLSRNLSRVIVVAMLHDVNDHKYDDEQKTLAKRVENFLFSIAQELLITGCSDTEGCGSDEDVVRTVMQCTDAISYSKENKRGMRWFEEKLPSPAWVVVRDSVSDSDKLEAIGYSGLLRCYEFATHLLKSQGKWEASLEAHGVDRIGALLLLPHVLEHSDEKLLRLKDAYIVTPAGKHLASPLHDEMVAGLKQWEINGPPALSSLGIMA